MELWLDTADILAIKKANELGIFYGVTTNPSIFAQAQCDAKKLINELLKSQPGLVAVQVTYTDHAQDMIEQARKLSELSDRIVVKIPATPVGIKAMSGLKKHKVPVLATAISSISQFTFSALAGAAYAALYLSHMQNAGKNILAEIEAMLWLTEKHQWNVKLMGAAFADAQTAQAVIASGVPSITVPEAIFEELLAIDPLVQKQFDHFEKAWQQYQQQHQADLLVCKTR